MPPWDRYRQPDEAEQESARPAPWQRYSAASRPPARTAYERNQGREYVSRDQATDPNAARQRESNLMRNYSDFGGGVQSVSQGATFGFGDEIEGGLNAFGAGVAEATQPGSDYFDRIGRAARTAYEDTTDTSRLFMERNRERAPVTTVVNEIGGGGVVGGGAGAVRNRLVAMATRGRASVPALVRPPVARPPVRTLGGRAVEGVQGGYAGGYIYGFGASDGDLGERLEDGSYGGAIGATVGGATPYAVRAAEPVWRAALRGGGALARTAERVIPTPAPNSVGMSGGNLAARPPGGGALRRPPPAPPPPDVSGEQLNFVNRMREREMLSVDDLDQTFAEARARPQGQRVVDLFGDTGTRTFRPIVQGPGQTSRLAQDAAENRFANAPEQLELSLRRGLQVGETLDEAMTRLRDDYRGLNPQYRELFSQETTPQQRALFDQRIAPLLAPDNPNMTVREIMRDAVDRAQRQFDLDRQAGVIDGNFDDNLGRFLHYVKGAIGDRAEFDASPLRGVAGREIAGIRSLYRQFSDMIDPTGNPDEAIIPGYRTVTGEAGDYFTAREALQEGADFVGGSRSSPEAVQRRFAEMTPFERRHARIGLADAILRGTEGATGGRNVNVARSLTNRRLQRVIAAAFETPEEAARFLSLVGSDESTRAAPGLYRLMDNASQWRGGAQTYANAMHGNDEAVQAGADMVGSAVQGNPAAAVGRGARWLQNQATLGMVERANNQRGEIALRRVDTEDARAFTDELIRLLREREARATAGQAITAPAAGVAGSRRE